MVEYTVVLATAVFALTVPLNGPGSNNAIQQIEQVLRDNYEGYSFAVTLSEMPDAVSMEQALQMVADAGGDPSQLVDAGSMIQQMDDFIGTSIESYITTTADFSVADLLTGELPTIGESEGESSESGPTPLYNESGEPMSLDTVFIDGDGDLFELTEPELFGADVDTPLTQNDVCTDATGFVRLPVADTSTTPPTQQCTGAPVTGADGLAVHSTNLVTNQDGNLAERGSGFVIDVDDDGNDILLNEDDVIIKDGGIFLDTEPVDTGGFGFNL